MLILKHILTGKDNFTFDIIRVLGLLAVLLGLGLVGFDVLVKGRSFDLQAFGLGVGAVFASLGVALRLKQDTEPDAGGRDV